MFTQARIKLTLWYSAIILLITISVSALFYVRTSQIISTEYDRINLRIQREMDGFGPPPGIAPGRRITPEDLREAKEQIIWQLVGINIMVVAFFSVVGYWLTGITLKPIRESHEAQRAFVSNAAHELRTPITALKTSLEVAQMEKNLPAGVRTALKSNITQVNSMAALSNQLLNLARVEETTLTAKPVDLLKPLQAAVEAAQIIAQSKSVSIEFTKPKHTITVLGDPELLQDAIQSLLENAIKYSEKKKPVRLEISETQSAVTISVEDKGAGIADADLPHIFKRFYRGDAARTNSATDGYGLRLSIVSAIASQHHGKVSVTSKVGRGSTFSLTIPKAKS